MVALSELAEELDPELVVVTGDLAHRGRRAELERAAALLRGLGRSLLVVPGNHDIPYNVPGRFTRTWDEWRRVFREIEPVYRSDELVVVGLVSVKPWRQQGGALDPEQIERVGTHFREAPASALRVVALHHHLAAPPWRAGRKRPLSRRDTVLQSLAEAGAELVVSGHVHQAGVAERREFEVLEGGTGQALVLATAPGFGRPRPHRKGEALGVNVYEAEKQSLAVTTHVWDGSGFVQIAQREFRRR
jgi:3',5'-cyclic AMP phosphodiesterase CpdA